MQSTSLVASPTGSEQVLVSALYAGLQLWSEAGTLRFRGPGGDMPREVRAGLQAHRDEVVARLRDGIRYAPASCFQERIWFLERLEPGTATYHMLVGAALRGPLDVPALERALHGVIRRHEVLRTSFEEVCGRPVQRIHRDFGWALEVVDLTAEPGDSRDQRADAVLRERAGAPFDLRAAPLLRGTLVRVGVDDARLLLVVHHAVFDGWSRGVLSQELEALYAAERGGTPAALPQPAPQFADEACRQRAWLATEAAEGQLAYWREQHRHAFPQRFPAREAGRLSGLSGAHHTVRVPAELVAAVEAAGRASGATLFMTLLSALQLLLARVMDAPEAVVAVPVATRDQAGAEHLAGPLLNTIALRGRAHAGDTFDELVGRTREACLAGFNNRHAPYELVLQQLDDPAIALTRVLFALQGPPSAGLRLSGVATEPIRLLHDTAKFDLGLIAVPAEDALDLTFEYRPEVVEADEVERLARQYVQVLREVGADPRVRVGRVRLADAAARARVLAMARGGGTGAVPGRGVPARVWEHALRRPHAIAVVGADGAPVTYGELARDARSLAGALAELGVGAESRVGVLVERGPAWIAAVLGVMRTGAAYVALDRAHPEPRLGWMLRDSGASVLLTDDAAGAEAWAGGGLHVLDVRRASARGAASPPAADAREPDPEQAAYVIYTSGSTGEPKGVVCTHGGLAALAEWTRTAFRLAEEVRTTQVAGVGFDAAGWEVWPTLAAGGRVHVAPEAARRDAEALRDWLVDSGARVSFVPTPLAEPLLELAWPAGTALRFLLTGGDRLQRHPPEGLPFQVVNNYGPTEATVVGTSGLSAPRRERDGSAPTVGAPVPHADARVLDEAMHPVPVGVPGELYLGGAGVARGYLRSPALTAERFLPDPFSGRPGARIYRTGDRVRWSPTGELDFLGRVDGQVKLRGYRIEVGEIESAARSAPGVREAAVVLHEGEPARLVAYVVPMADTGDSRGELERAVRAAVRARLPEYMVPALVGVAPALPLTPNGKVDRRALESWPLPDADAPPDAAPPRTEQEERVAASIAAVLGRAGVQRDDDFFQIGGHSLAAMQVVALLRSEHGFELRLQDVFERRTVAAMAAALEPAGDEDGGYRDGTAAAETPYLDPVPW